MVSLVNKCAHRADNDYCTLYKCKIGSGYCDNVCVHKSKEPVETEDSSLGIKTCE